MPINFFKFQGEREPGYSRQDNLCQTIMIWHEQTLRFVIIQLRPLLYGLDISKYARAISLQLENTIPSFTQLQLWLEKIDPKAVQAKILVGQLFATEKDYRLQLQASSDQEILFVHENSLYKLVVSPEGLTGKFQAGDRLLAGSEEWFNSPENVVWESPNQLEEKLLSISKLQLESVQIMQISYPKTRKFPDFKKFLNINFSTIFKPKKEELNIAVPEMSVKHFKPLENKRKFALILALVFLSLLVSSVGLGIHKRNQFNQTQKEIQLVENVKYRLDQAKSLQQLNPTRAKVLLGEAKQALNEYIQTNKLPSQTITDLEAEVAKAYELVSGLVLISQAPLFYDPYLLKDNFIPTQVSLSDLEITLLDNNNLLAATVELESKAAKIIAGENVVKNNSKLASIPSWIFLNSGNNIAIIDKNTQKRIKSYNLSKTTVSDLIGYGNNLYILDVPAGQVLRFRGQTEGLSKAEDFFTTKQDFAGAASLAVDGSVWILYGNGAVEKYTSGVRDALFTDFSMDKPLKQASQLFTDENQKQLYIMDKLEGRIVAISKQGEFKAEYSWEGLKACDDFVVSEAIGKILVLKDGKIWGVPLK